eukprot:1153042-Pelagomonas_calceolata.AAC.2
MEVLSGNFIFTTPCGPLTVKEIISVFPTVQVVVFSPAQRTVGGVLGIKRARLFPLPVKTGKLARHNLSSQK